MELRKTLILVHSLFESHKIQHALISGLGLACYGSTRATSDLDLLIHEDNKFNAKELLADNNFTLHYESDEVLQFSGNGYVDLLIARRPISKEILKNTLSGGPEGIHYARAEDLIGLKIQAYKNNPKREFQDKADIQFLIQSQKNMDWNLIEKYAKLFKEWSVIEEIRKKIRSN